MEAKERSPTTAMVPSSSSSPSVPPSVVASPPPPAAAAKTMAEMHAERTIALRAAAAASSSSPLSSPSLSSPSSAPSLDVSAFPPWCEVVWERIRDLLTTADVDLDGGRVPSALVGLTHALHLHSALPSDYPRSVLHNLLAYRSVAHLKLIPPSPHWAVYDAITSLKMHRDYTHAYGLLFNAWKAMGNEKKAMEAAEVGRKTAEMKGELVLMKRFEDMTAQLQREAAERLSGEQGEHTTAVNGGSSQKKKKKKGEQRGRDRGGGGRREGPAMGDSASVAVEVRNVRADQQIGRSEFDLSLFQDKAVRSLTSNTKSTHTPRHHHHHHHHHHQAFHHGALGLALISSASPPLSFSLASPLCALQVLYDSRVIPSRFSLCPLSHLHFQLIGLHARSTFVLFPLSGEGFRGRLHPGLGSTPHRHPPV